MTRPYDAFIAAMQQGIPPIRPDDLADLESSEGICGLQSNNTDIDRTGWAYADISDTEAAIKGYHCEDRR